MHDFNQVEGVAPATKSIVVAKDSDFIIEAFKALIENHISSAPVLNTENGEYHYFIDLSDMLAHAVDILTENEIKEGFDPEISQIEFSRYKVAQLAGYSPTNRFREISKKSTLREAIVTLMDMGVHRLVVTDPETHELVSILSQSEIINILYPYISQFEFKDKTVAEMQLGYRITATVNTEMLTKEAFKKLHSGRYEGLAVTDKHDLLVGNISISDLASIGHDGSMFKRLMWPLGKFLEGKLAKPHSNKAKHGLAGILSVNPENTMRQVFDKFHQTEVHRLYVEQNGKLLGVIVLSDLVNLILRDPVFDPSKKVRSPRRSFSKSTNNLNLSSSSGSINIEPATALNASIGSTGSTGGGHSSPPSSSSPPPSSSSPLIPGTAGSPPRKDKSHSKKSSGDSERELSPPGSSKTEGSSKRKRSFRKSKEIVKEKEA